MIEYGYYFVISLFIIVFTIGIISIWTDKYDNYFVTSLIGPISFSNNDSKELLGKLRQISTVSYLYNLIVLIVLIIIYPTSYPIVTTGLALTVPLNRKFITNHFKDKYGVEESTKSRKANKVFLWILTIGIIGVISFLIVTDNPLSTMVIGLFIYMILAIVLKFLVDSSKKGFSNSSGDNIDDRFKK